MREAPRALGERIDAVFALDPAARALEFEGRWRSWGELAATARSLAEHAAPGARIGVLLRNRPAPVGLALGVLRAGACLVAIDPGRGAASLQREIAGLELAALAGEAGDLAAHAPAEAGVTTLVADALGAPVGARRGAGAAARAADPGVAVQMPTSGTTGPPKRVDLSYDTLLRSLGGARHYESKRGHEGPRLRSGVAVLHSPLVHVAGLFRVLQCVTDGRAFALLERFSVEGWLDAVRRHRPATSSLVPAALRMVLEADLDPAELASLRSVVSGTAPLSPDDADAFTGKYGVPVLGSYGATEFGGGVAGWNLADHQRFWKEKRGSIGRAHPGCALRVVDAESGADRGVDAEGLLEVKAAQLGGDAWVRTTDLARIDADGFVWIVGRADQVILRGGFKVHPDAVRAALERHPAVRGAAVLGRRDARLGAVPVAAVELREGAAATPRQLLDHAAASLARYELPVDLRIVDALPRTPSAKVDLAAVGALFGER